jgi:hypothetical protein
LRQYFGERGGRHGDQVRRTGKPIDEVKTGLTNRCICRGRRCGPDR